MKNKTLLGACFDYLKKGDTILNWYSYIVFSFNFEQYEFNGRKMLHF